MSYARNARCFCGSGQKYKHCHYGKPFHPEREVSVHQRNLILLAAARETFGFSKVRTWSQFQDKWANFKRNISGDQIRRFYYVQADLSAPDTDWAAIMPDPDGKLRALYLGDIRPETTIRNLARFSLYSDHLFVVNPFHNPWILKPEYNPIVNPDQYKADTINLLHFLFIVSPWIESGILTLIPDPGELNVALKWETARLAKERIGDTKPDERDLAQAIEVGREEYLRLMFALPEEKFYRQLDEAGEATGTTYSTEEKRELFEAAKYKLRNDPIAWEMPGGENFRDGQMMPFRSGANLETALLICSMTGAFPYTNMHMKWREIIGAREELSETAKAWSPLTKAFQELEFRFLDNADPTFAQNIRQDGRLESFRTLLRRIGKGATEITDMGSLDNFVRDCKDELTGEYQKARADWQKIDEAFLRWATTGIGAALVGGHMVPNISALTTASVTTIGQLGIRYLKQARFRRENPLSVFIDLARKEPDGVKLY